MPQGNQAVVWGVSLVIAWGSVPTSAGALEQTVEDLSASVQVAEVFELSLSDLNLAFHQVTPGQDQVLGEGHFFNEMRCRSNVGRRWQLHAQLVELTHVERQQALSPERLSWNVVESTGAAEPAGGRSVFKPFSDRPEVIYVSQGDDQRGQPVVLRFQYRLSCPEDAPPGQYIGQIVFTMVEAP